MKTILVCNDDGAYGLGLKPLILAMRTLGKVVVIVPDSERSAESHSITLHKPFRVQAIKIGLNKKESMDIYTTNGTPADCVRFGILKVLKGKKVDLVVGGINQGLNLGEDAIYSGTVAVAREAALQEIQSMALSTASGDHGDYASAAKVSIQLARMIFRQALPLRTFLNVNVPIMQKGSLAVQVTKLGKRLYGKEIAQGIDPRGRPYYWLAGEIPSGIAENGTDIAAIRAKKISVTPLMVDATCDTFLPELSGRISEENYKFTNRR